MDCTVVLSTNCEAVLGNTGNEDLRTRSNALGRRAALVEEKAFYGARSIPESLGKVVQVKGIRRDVEQSESRSICWPACQGHTTGS